MKKPMTREQLLRNRQQTKIALSLSVFFGAIAFMLAVILTIASPNPILRGCFFTLSLSIAAYYTGVALLIK